MFILSYILLQLSSYAYSVGFPTVYRAYTCSVLTVI